MAIPSITLPHSRQLIMPTPKDEADKTTIFSIYPQAIKEEKITIFPSTFIIPAGSPEKPSRIVVGGSSWWKEIHDSNQLLEIPVYSSAVAKSIVEDYCSSLLAYSPNAHPGLFYVPGDVTVEDGRKNYSKAFAEANTKQRAYFHALVTMADVLWVRTQKNPHSISEVMRIAAKALNLENKEWLENYQAVNMTNCPACGSIINPNFPICSSCKHVVNPDAYKKLGLKPVE